MKSFYVVRNDATAPATYEVHDYMRRDVVCVVKTEYYAIIIAEALNKLMPGKM